jgi:hypothetical protein
MLFLFFYFSTMWIQWSSAKAFILALTPPEAFPAEPDLQLPPDVKAERPFPAAAA